jgi:hypothetical protein
VYGRSVRSLALIVLTGAALGACGAAPPPRPIQPAAGAVERRSANAPDDCAEIPGQAAPEPLLHAYTGVAAGARCQREVYTIMGGVTHFLGVSCGYCHQVPNYEAPTHRKEVANWMATELVPHLRKKHGASPLWCNDCHAAEGQPQAKILGDPRNESWAIEWMTTHMVENFETAKGSPLRCKSCHKGNVGTPEFQGKIIATGNLPND